MLTLVLAAQGGVCHSQGWEGQPGGLGCPEPFPLLMGEHGTSAPPWGVLGK